MRWTVEFHPDFEPEFDALEEDVQDEIEALALVLEQFGPGLGRYAEGIEAREHEGATL